MIVFKTMWQLIKTVGFLGANFWRDFLGNVGEEEGWLKGGLCDEAWYVYIYK